MREPNFKDDLAGLGILLRKWAVILVISAVLWVLIILGVKAAIAAPYMGDCKLADQRTYTVSIDPDLSPSNFTHADVARALQSWNDAFIAEYGFPIFAPHFGDWQDADVLLTAHGSGTTWVKTRCHSGYVQRGNNLAIVFLGNDVQPRWLTHELGHVLGFSDYIFPQDDPRGFLLPGVCYPASAPISIMSYCWQQQPVVLLPDDLELIRGYWR